MANALGLSPKTTSGRYCQLKAYFGDTELSGNGNAETEDGTAPQGRAKSMRKAALKQTKKTAGTEENEQAEETSKQETQEVKKEEDEEVKVKVKTEEEDEDEEDQVVSDDSDDEEYVDEV